MRFEPVTYTEKSLAAHGKMIAERLGLSSEQARCLVPEIRNALSAATICTSGDKAFTLADVEDIKNAIRRLVAVAQAIADLENQKSR